jgi:plastocyanin
MQDSPLTRRRLLAVAGALGLGAVAAACGASRDEDTGSGPTGAKDSGPEGEGGAAARADVKIDMKDIKYVPAAATAKVGDTVLWTNSDAVAHTVTKTGGPGPAFDSGTIPAGGTYTQTMKAPGRIDYVCTIHPNQTGTLTVK